MNPFLDSNKPKKHCACNTHLHAIPMPIKGRSIYVDICIADLVSALNAANILTDGCCCGHGKMPGSILLTDGRVLLIGGRELLEA